jgi:DNA processing protein
VIVYVHGALQADDETAVAVVGTRGPTVYGREMARRLSAGLAEAGVTVLSGMARGIDGIAHAAALDAEGRTIAVLGGGLDSIYPAEHAPLSRRIAGAGALVSEYPLGMRPRAEHFPRRNRVISGMGLGVVVVEGGMKSGALLTVRHALDQNREVFAVPGSAISKKSEGTNWLIQQGAKLVTNVSDILEELNIPGPGTQIRLGDAGPAGGSRRPRDPLHVELLERLAGGSMHVDELTRATGFASGTVSSALAVMELKGFVQQVGPMQYAAPAAAAHESAGNPQRGG